jgi:hypothetical protein
MGILDDLKHKAEELGDKAKESLDAARDRAGDLVGDVKERLAQRDGGGDETDGEDESAAGTAPLGASAHVGPDTSSTGTVQPDYVTGEDEDLTDADTVSEGDLDAEEASDEDGVLDSVATTETDAADPVDPTDPVEPVDPTDPVVPVDPSDPVQPAGPGDPTDVVDEPAVETDVDPYDQPLTEPIGDVIDPATLAAVVEDTSDRDS